MYVKVSLRGKVIFSMIIVCIINWYRMIGWNWEFDFYKNIYVNNIIVDIRLISKKR